VIKICDTPQQLLTEVNKLGSLTIIKAEYSQSQLKTTGILYNKKDALKAFGLDYKKATISEYFKN
jgi:hypothetical protein